MSARTPAPVTWLVLVHNLPAKPTRLRVRVWRQLQKLGAVAVKNSVYVLPWSEKTREDFTWLAQEIETGGGQAALFRATAVTGATDAEIIAASRGDRDAAYARLAAAADGLSRRMAGRQRGVHEDSGVLDPLEKEVERMQAESDAIQGTDFFKASGSKAAISALARCRTLLRAVQGRETNAPTISRDKASRLDRARFKNRLWITRPRPHIDRCASAWLIRRFVDPRARFAFVAEGGRLRGGIPFDMQGAEFGHHGEDCTFETLMKQFGLTRDPAVRAIAEIVHDIDLKDTKFGRPEAAGISAVLAGLAEGVRDDQGLVRGAEAVFDGLYAGFATGPARGMRKKGNATRRRK